MIHLQTLEKKVTSHCGGLGFSTEPEDEDEREVFLGHVVASVLRESGRESAGQVI